MATADDTPAVTWARVDRDFFVASTPQFFLGTVDRGEDASFVARDMRSDVLGTFSDLASAMKSVELHRFQPSALLTPMAEREGEW